MARYRGPKQKIARRFREPIFGPSKSLERKAYGSAATVQETLWRWIHIGDLQLEVGFQVDPLTALFLLIITGIGFLIHVYSVGYMADEEHYGRFFAFLNLFVFFMLVLVLADNLLLMFVGW